MLQLIQCLANAFWLEYRSKSNNNNISSAQIIQQHSKVEK